MTPNARYKTLNDGSIDYGYYIQKGHALRSQGAHGGLKWLFGLATMPFSGRRSTVPTNHGTNDTGAPHAAACVVDPLAAKQFRIRPAY